MAQARASRADVRVLVVGEAFRLIPTADALYHADAKWWLDPTTADAADFAGERWTQDHGPGQADAVEAKGLQVIASIAGSVPVFSGKRIAQGMNSGFQAVNLAVAFGAIRVVLLGFDLARGPDRRTHFFGNRTSRKLAIDSPFDLFIKAFAAAAPVYAQQGVTILNASRRSALTCFRKADLEEELT